MIILHGIEITTLATSRYIFYIKVRGHPDAAEQEHQMTIHPEKLAKLINKINEEAMGIKEMAKLVGKDYPKKLDNIIEGIRLETKGWNDVLKILNNAEGQGNEQ